MGVRAGDENDHSLDDLGNSHPFELAFEWWKVHLTVRGTTRYVSLVASASLLVASSFLLQYTYVFCCFSRIILLFSAGYVFNTILAPAFGLPLNPQAAAEGKNLLSASLATIDTYWLQKDGSFLLGNSQPSLADLSLVCEIMQLQV